MKKYKSRRCPFCQSRRTQKVGEFALCLECHEPFHHNPKDEDNVELEDAEEQSVESVGGTQNEETAELRT